MNSEEKQRHYDRAESLLAEQNFAAAVIAGGIATLLAATAYGITVATWPIAHGFAAAGVGIFIGFTIGFLGRGISTKFPVIATGFTIAGLLLGNLFRVVMVLAIASSTSPIDVLRNESLSMLTERAMSHFSFVGLVYGFVAVVAAVFLARRPLSRADRLAIGLFETRGYE
ncbi:MAG: hypothetical protein QNI96_09725 [Woeseiaceae bacterium]|nr:hypothetical protein [Woeseiaceae bacterium]